MSKTLSICVPVLNQIHSLTVTLNSLQNNASQKLKYILVDNGSNPPIKEFVQDNDKAEYQIIRFDKNQGLPKAMNEALNRSDADYIFFTHSDICMYEKNWDLKVIKAIEEAGNVGIAGFFGALGIGVNGIYQVPYEMNQLVRTNPISGNKCRLDSRVHGQMQFQNDWTKCAVLDGFSLIVKNTDKLRFWSDSVHHMYDNDICLEAISNGMDVICINMDVDHFGGRTDVGEDWASPFGKTKQQVHSEAHIPFYEKWRPGRHSIGLPYRVI